VKAAAISSHRNRATLRREQLADHAIRQMVQKVQAGHLEWKDIADHSFIYKINLV
jgi:hypothetical protein